MKIMNDTNSQQNNNEDGIFGSPLNFSTNTTQTTQGVTEEKEVDKETEKTDTFIDQSKKTETETENPEDIISMGVTFVDDSKPVVPEKNIFSQDSSFKNKEIDAIQTIINPAPVEQSIKKETQILTPENTQNFDTKDLEKDFSETFHTTISPSDSSSPESDPISLEQEKLHRLYKELKEKATSKKIIVKERLEKLKLEKETLGKELEDIKEIEAIAQKLEEKLKALKVIDTEIDSLEAQAQQELQ